MGTYLRLALDREIKHGSARKLYLQPLGSDEIYIRPILNKLAQTNGELVVDSSLRTIRTFIKFRRIILKDRHIQDRKVLINHVHVTHWGIVIKIFFYEFDTYRQVTLRSTESSASGSRNFGVALACLGPVLGIPDTCDCASCVLERRLFGNLDWTGVRLQCPLPSCSEMVHPWSVWSHLRSHLFHSDLYHCDHHGCTHKCKRWDDLMRHASTCHCLNARKFPCGFPGCERGGENGFARKDKMNEHFKNVHLGVGIPPKNPRRLAPKN